MERRTSRDDRDDDRGSRRDRDEPTSRRGSRDEEPVSRRGSREEEPARRSSRDDEPRRSSRDDDRGSRDRGRDRDDDRGSRRPKFEYQERDAAETKKRAKMGNNDFDKILVDSIQAYKVRDDDNRIRILPPTWPGAKHYGFDVHVHYGVGADRGTYICLQKMKDEPCPICEERDRQRQELQDFDGSKAEREDLEKYIKDLSPKRRVLFYLIDRDDEKSGVQAWAAPYTVDGDIVRVSEDRQTGEVLQVDHPEDGFDVEFAKTGQKDRTKYEGVAIARRSTPLGKDAWLEYAQDHPLPDQLNYFDYDHIAKAFGGKGEKREARRDDDRDEDRRPSRDRDDDRGHRDRDRDESPRRGSRDRDEDRKPAKDESPTWESIHGMTFEEMCDLVDAERLDIKPKEAKDDEDLADWICEEMKLKKAEVVERRGSRRDDADDADKLAKMRRERERD